MLLLDLVMMHLVGGSLFVIMLGGGLWHLKIKQVGGSIRRPLFFKAGILGALFVVTIAWEVFEVMLPLVPNWTHSVSDTLFDILFALIGAIFTLIFIRSND